jgi:hypothetical protein
MKCEKCKYKFDPRTQEKSFGGHDDTVEICIQCPRCDANYSHWIAPEDWTLQDGS